MSLHITMSQPPKIYGMHVSAGCRLALWAANTSNVAVEWEQVDLMKGEHMTEEYVRLTKGRHCIPALSHTLEDGSALEMTESRAIAKYLAHIGDGSVKASFPDAPHLTAQLDELIDYDATCLYSRVGDIAYYRMGFRPTEPDEKKFEALNKSLAYIESRLGDSGFLVGDTLSVADLNLANTLSMLAIIPEIEVEKSYPATGKWLAHMQTLGNYSEIVAPFNQFVASKSAAEDGSD